MNGLDTTSLKIASIPLDVRPLVDKVTLTSYVKFNTARKVEEVSEREFAACKVLLFAQNFLVDIQPGIERSGKILSLHFIRL